MLIFDKQIDAAVFDMDGTMFDTERLRFKMLKKASEEIYGKEISDDLLYNSLGVSEVTGEKLAKSEYGQDYPYKNIRRRANELERAYVREHGVPIKTGLYNLLEKFKKNNIFIALATSTRREIAEEYLIRAKVFRYFDILVCGDDVKNGKPNPEIFIKAINELNCKASECLIFEDSSNGILAANAAGGIPIYIKDIKDPEDKVKQLAFKEYVSMSDFINDLTPFIPTMPLPQLYEPFPQHEDLVIAGIHGFGAIGGGYLAQIFSHWDGYTRPLKIIGATRNQFIKDLVNLFGTYQINYESLAYFQVIPNVEIIDTNNETDMIDMYKKSDIIGLSLPENSIELQSKIIAKGLMERYKNGVGDLTILIIMNKINAVKFVKNHIFNSLKEITDEANAEDVINRTFFCETVVNRMVSQTSEEFILTRIRASLYQLHKNVFEYSDDIKNFIDLSETFIEESKVRLKEKKRARNNAKSEIDLIKISENLSTLSNFMSDISNINVVLFSSEPDMPIYAVAGNSLIHNLRQVIEIEDISSMQEIKNKLSNGTHAVIAWYSSLLGYKTIGQGMGDERVLSLVFRIMKDEISPALLIENPGYRKYMNEFISSFIRRCRTSFKDSCHRVGRDPLRKLQNGERVIGAIKLCKKHGISSDGMEFGAACAILYSIKDLNPKDHEAVKIKLLYEKNHLVSDILNYNGECNNAIYTGLTIPDDNEIIMRIQKNFDEFNKVSFPSSNIL